MAGSIVSLDDFNLSGIVISGAFVYPTPTMWYNASWLIAAGLFYLNFGIGLYWTGC
jgi:hypothetical protein